MFIFKPTLVNINNKDNLLLICLKDFYFYMFLCSLILTFSLNLDPTYFIDYFTFYLSLSIVLRIISFKNWLNQQCWFMFMCAWVDVYKEWVLSKLLITFWAYSILILIYNSIHNIYGIILDIPLEPVLEILELINAHFLEMTGGEGPSNDGGQPGGSNQGGLPGQPGGSNQGPQNQWFGDPPPKDKTCRHECVVWIIYKDVHMKTLILTDYNLNKGKVTVDYISDAKLCGNYVEIKSILGQKIVNLHANCLEGEDRDNYTKYYGNAFENIKKEYKVQLKILRGRYG